MKPPARIVLRSALRLPFQSIHPSPTIPPLAAIRQRQQQIHTTDPAPATVSPNYAAGPPPSPPEPPADSGSARLERRKRQEEHLKNAQAIRQQQAEPKPVSKKEARESLLRKRYWKDAHVREVDGAWEVHLDERPLRRANTNVVLRIPLTKGLLAAALAVEWDMLLSARQSTRSWLTPLASLICRALDIADDDKAAARGEGDVRMSIVAELMHYLDTDTLLCWAPPPPPRANKGRTSLRDLQIRATNEVVGFLTTRVWPYLTIGPVLDGDTVVLRPHPEITRGYIQDWMMHLSPWELAGLERGALAGKSLLGAVRLLVEWSEEFTGTVWANEADNAFEGRFGVEEAARLASIEVDWQTGWWGEVEDTHDVEKEDLRRQLGSVVLLVSGTGRK
ncbi:ATP12-domain-containing protein [Jackrogersella minutella]|nr:ATP12-domain-containing protein [Jackrogersella minutella]